MPRLKKQAEQEQASISVHFVAFDVAASVFAPLKKLGATVVGASDEKQLNAQLEFILQRKILLEDEELPVKK
jgi:glutamyl-tRNA reductase